MSGRAAAAVAIAVAALVVVSSGAAVPTVASIDQRTRTVAIVVKHCGRAATTALRAVTRGSALKGRKAVSSARVACDAAERQLLALPTDGLEFIPEDALAALDDWRRGLGRLSGSIASGSASSLAQARRKLASGDAWLARVLLEVDAVRLKNRLAPLQPAAY